LDPDWYAIRRMKKHIIAVGWRGGTVKVCQVVFYRGALLVCFPYHPDVDGIAARKVLPARPESQVHLRDGGKVTSHKVRYTHWADGNTHFSQDGKVRTEVRNEGQSLLGDPGHIFSIDVQGLPRLRVFTPEEYYGDKYGSAYFELDREGPPPAVHIVGRWYSVPKRRRIEDLRNPLLLPADGGGYFPTVGLAPPPGSPLDGHMLFVEVRAVPLLDPAREPDQFVLTFSGGFEEGLDDPTVEASCLFLQYPAIDTSDLPRMDLERERVG